MTIERDERKQKKNAQTKLRNENFYLTLHFRMVIFESSHSSISDKQA